MTKRSDTTIRYVLLVIGMIAIGAMFWTAANEVLDHAERFARLAMLGTLATMIFVATDVGSPYVDRTPLLPRLGRPSRQPGPPADGPSPHAPTSDPMVFGLALGPTLGALVGSAIVAFVTATIGYALSRQANSNGGLLTYIFFGAACLVALRCICRLLTSRRAVALSSERLTLGVPLGHMPPTTIDRRSVSAIEIGSEPQQKIAIIGAEGRRFEICPDHLRQPGLAGYIAASWPEVPWYELPETSRRF
ncbi:MAG: hypothetical protein GY720_24505 [bacterium]|nr:hypothetical protein [bacterium]